VSSGRTSVDPCLLRGPTGEREGSAVRFRTTEARKNMFQHVVSKMAEAGANRPANRWNEDSISCT
jgi:hypothetical protein